MVALAKGALRVLYGKEEQREYHGADREPAGVP
jgi:butyrate kinase